jgi:hypothetical protein
MKLLRSAHRLENLARKNDNAQCGPLKAESKPKNADRQDVLPAKIGEMKGRTAWSDESGRSCILFFHIFI